MSIENCRNEIDEIETQLIEIISRRAQCALEIGGIKRTLNLPIFDAKREDEILERVASKNKGPLSDESMQSIFKELILQTRNFEDLHSKGE